MTRLFTTALMISALGLTTSCLPPLPDLDAGSEDGGDEDGGADAGQPDAARPDSGGGTDTAPGRDSVLAADSSESDTAMPDAAEPDSAMPDAAEPDASSVLECFANGGSGANLSGAGTCADPKIVDLTTVAVGDEIVHGGADAPNDETDNYSMDTCAGGATGWDMIYQVTLPAAATHLEVSVDAAAGANPVIGIHEDPSCGQPVNYCADQGGAGECEVVSGGRNGPNWFGSPTYVSVSEVTWSNMPLTIRFRAMTY